MSSQHQAQPKTILLRPYHRSNSDRMLESTKNSPNPEYLNQPEQLTISNHSFIESVDEKGKRVRKHTRWFYGCDSIFMDEQIENDRINGIVGRKIEFGDTIHIKSGLLELTNDPEVETLFQFLTTHNDNISNPNRIKPKGGENTAAFEQIDFQKDASKEMNEMEQREMAFELLNACKKGMGATREFNLNELNKLAKIFGAHKPTPEETYILLSNMAKDDPGYFVSKIEKSHFVVVHDFEAAKEQGVITWNKGEYSMGDKVVFTASDKKANKQDAEFIAFISSENGSAVYNDMRTQITITQLQPK